MGPLVDLHELQAVPYWDVETILKILPFITVQSQQSLSLKEMLTHGDALLLARYSRVLQQQHGYDEDTANRYAGDPSRILLRYKYQYKTSLQYGVTVEKDAGERVFKTFQNPFDFTSFHFYKKGSGLVKAVAQGDYTINLGQGLVQWQSLAFKKSSEVAGLVRQSAVVRPYSGAGEFYFNRGGAITLQKGWWQATAFASARRLTASLKEDSSGQGYFTSFNTSGLHRTRNELQNRKNVARWSYGGNISYQSAKLKLGPERRAALFFETAYKR